MKEAPEMKQLVDNITSYRKMLRLMNIEDTQVKLFKQRYWNQVFLMLMSLIRLILSLIFMLPGSLMLMPLTTTISFYSERERIRCLKASTVKIMANDVLASVKI